MTPPNRSHSGLRILHTVLYTILWYVQLMNICKDFFIFMILMRDSAREIKFHSLLGVKELTWITE